MYNSINIDAILEIADKFDVLINEYDLEINKLFTRLHDIPTETKEWIGNHAKDFSNIVLEEKKDYTNFSKDLKAFSEEIKLHANKIKYEIKRNNV